MDNTALVIIGIIILTLLAVVFIYKKRKGIKPDANAMFIIGISWIPLGIATENHTFTVLGIVFMIIGAQQKHKNKGDEVQYSKLPPAVKRVRVILIVVAAIIFVAGIVMYYFQKGSS
jgi:LPXTG-motif cell wall-anchored protein